MRNILHLKAMIVYSTVILLSSKGYSQQPQYAYASNKSYKGYSLQSNQKQTLLSVLKELNKLKGVYFLYSQEGIGEKMVSPVANPNDKVEKILDDILDGTGLSYKKVLANTYVIIQSGEKLKPRKDLKTAISVPTGEQEK